MDCQNRSAENTIRNLLCLTLVPLLLVLLMCAYWPGLEGNFHFDDFANIAKLVDFGGIRDSKDFFAFVIGGIAGPTGRPVSLLSFLLNDVAWPSEARPFLYTNLLIHCLNGLLLTWVIYRLLCPIEAFGERTAILVALITGAFWSLHPLHVSTVLYVVQRMTLLSAMSVLLGILSYLVGRARLLDSRKYGYFWMSMAIVLFAPLAVLSKENGALFPLLVLVLEGTIIRSLWPKPDVLDLRWKWLFLYLPSMLLFVYLGYRGIGAFQAESSGIRDFTVVERLLTESRILMDYLGKLFIPSMQSGGLFNDFALSRSLFDPLATALSILTIIALFVLAVRYRKTAPFMAVATLFFFVGHLLESTVLMLELYFEHRNYLPSMLLFLPVGVFFVKGQLSLKLRVVVLVVFVSMLTFLTWQRAKLWGDPVALTLTWAQESPRSARAQRSAALQWGHLRQPDKALQVLELAKENIPGDLSIHLHYLLQKCRIVGVPKEEVTMAILAAEEIPEKIFDLKIMQWLLTEMTRSDCRGIEGEDVLAILRALEKNVGVSQTAHRVRLVYHIEGIVHLLRDSGEKAYQAFGKCHDILPNLPTAMNQVGLLATHGYLELALEHLENAEKIDFNPGWKRSLTTLDYTAEIEHIKRQLVRDIANKRGRIAEDPYPIPTVNTDVR